MKTRFNWMMKFAAIALVIAATTVLRATAAQVTATLDSASIALGDAAQLTVSISGGDSTQPELPAVSGLEFTPVGQSSSFESVNGEVTSSVSLTYQVTPDRVGTFTIPSIRLPDGGSSQPLTLQVSQTRAVQRLRRRQICRHQTCLPAQRTPRTMRAASRLFCAW